MLFSDVTVSSVAPGGLGGQIGGLGWPPTDLLAAASVSALPTRLYRQPVRVGHAETSHE